MAAMWEESIILPSTHSKEHVTFRLHTHGFGVYGTYTVERTDKNSFESVLIHPEQVKALCQSLPELLAEAQIQDENLRRK